jgi:FkbM family methyltransferase
MSLRATLRDRLRAAGYVWFRKPDLPWGLDLASDLQRCGIDLGACRCVVDVGAHVGLESLRFAQMCPRAEVFAFEMMPSTFETLRNNVASQPRIRPHCCGMSTERGSVRVGVESNSQQHSLHHSVAPVPGGASETVELRRLDEVARDLGIVTIDLLKVDAEGHDLQVLQGASALFEASKVRAVVVEVDFGGSAVAHTPLAKIAEWLAPRGLRFVALHEIEVAPRGGAFFFDYANALFVRDAS